MVQIQAQDIIVAVTAAIVILLVLVLLGLSLANREKLGRSRLKPVAFLLFLVIYCTVALYFYIAGVIQVSDLIIMMGIILLSLLCFDWSKLKARKGEVSGQS